MPEVHVKGKIELDGKQAEKAIDQVISKVKKFENAIKSSIKIFGLFLAYRTIKEGTEAVAEHVEKVIKLSREYGITTDQAQKLLGLAVETLTPVEELVKQWKEVGQQIGKTVDEMRELNKYAQMSPSDINRVSQDLAGARSAALQAKGKGGSFWSTFMQNLKFGGGAFESPHLLPGIPKPIAGLADALQKNRESSAFGGLHVPGFFERAFQGFNQFIESKPPTWKKDAQMSMGAPNLNELQRIGAFSAQNPMVSLAKEQLQALKKIERNTQADTNETIGFE